MSYNKSILILLLSFIMQVAYANNKISGYVYDKDTNKPLAFANVIIKGTTIGTATDLDGHFSLANIKPGLYTVTASYSGYLSHDMELEINSDKKLVFKLEETSYDINAVVVTGTRTERTLKNVPVLTNVVSKKEIESTGATSISDALGLSLPNIRFSGSTASGGVSMQLAGLEAKYTVFLIDGEKISGETNGNIDYNRIKTADIDRIEIIKGASGLLYGSNAIGGVVNIITSKPQNSFEASMGSHYTRFNTLDSDVSFGFSHDKFSSKTSFYYNGTDGYDLDVSDLNIKTQGAFKSKSLKQKFDYRLSDKLNLEATGTYYDRNRFDAFPFPKKDMNYSYNIKSTYRFNTKDNISALWHSDTYITKDVEELIEKETKVYANTYSNARISGAFNIATINSINMGFEYIQDKLESTRIEGGSLSLYKSIFFIQDEMEFSDKFTAIAGVRAEYHSENGLHAVPQISAMYKFESLKLRSGYSLGYRSPTIKEMYMSFSPVPVVEIYGNPDLVPEASRYISLSAEYSKSIFNASVSVYQNNIKNMITEVQDLVDPKIWIYKNIKSAHVLGLDFNLRAKLKYGFSINASYSYTDSEDKTSGEQISGTSKNNGGIMLQHRFSMNNYSLSTNLMANYYGKIPYNEMDDISGEVTSKLYNANTIWKLTTTHQIYSGIILTLGIDNIFNSYETKNVMNLNPGRMYFAGLRLNIHKLNFNK